MLNKNNFNPQNLSFYKKLQELKVPIVKIFDNIENHDIQLEICKEVSNRPGFYMIVNKINNHKYVGSALCTNKQSNIYNRFLSHLIKKNNQGSTSVRNAVNEFGIENFIFIILEYYPYIFPNNKIINNYKITDPALYEEIQKQKVKFYERETFFIQELKCEFNKTKRGGSSHGYQHTEETKAKMSLIHSSRERQEMSAKTKAKIAATLTGSKKTLEIKTKISKSQIGRQFSEETRAKMSAARKGYKHTDETKAKISAATKGRKKPRNIINKDV
jgi:group I intron endonuclease